MACRWAATLIILAGVAPAHAQLPDTIVRELAGLDGAVTLGKWVRGHPRDSLARYAFDPFLQDSRWCAQAVAPARRTTRRTLTRRAVFYPPPISDTTPRPWPALPAAPDSAVIRSGCTLGVIEVDVAAAQGDSALDPLADSVRTVLSAVYGAPDTAGGAFYQAVSTWRRRARWQTGDRTVVTAVAPADKPRLLAFAHLPVSGLGHELGQSSRTDSLEFARDAARDSAAFEQAVAWAGAAPEANEPLRRLYHAWHSKAWSGPRPPDPLASVAPVLRRWRGAAARSGPAERAAALLAADRIVRLTAPSFDRTGPADSGRSTPFTRATGARYVYAELGGADAYAGNLLKEARQVAPASPAGRLALLLLLEGGLMDPVCGGATEGEDFRTVIAEGERFLGSDSTPEWRTRAHLAVADAYRDIVALDVGTLEYSIGDPARHHAEAPRARRRAVEHYRAALDSPTIDPFSASHAWNEAWRLLAMLAPGGTRYVCVYD
jgi:hypothetical protein